MRTHTHSLTLQSNVGVWFLLRTWNFFWTTYKFASRYFCRRSKTQQEKQTNKQKWLVLYSAFFLLLFSFFSKNIQAHRSFTIKSTRLNCPRQQPSIRVAVTQPRRLLVQSRPRAFRGWFRAWTRSARLNTLRFFTFQFFILYYTCLTIHAACLFF